MASFDVKRVTPLEWTGIGAGALGFIVSFFSWYTVSVSGLGITRSDGANAWDSGFLAWFSMLLLIAAAVVVVLPHFGTQVPNQSMIWLALSAASFLFVILRWITFDTASESGAGFSASAGAGFGLFVGLVLAAASGVAAFLNFRASSRTTAA